MLAAGERLNIHAVAQRCGVSHSLVYSRYPDIKERIEELKQSQAVMPPRIAAAQSGG
jgi:AcrR family transcriptional regulator